MFFLRQDIIKKFRYIGSPQESEANTIVFNVRIHISQKVKNTKKLNSIEDNQFFLGVQLVSTTNVKVLQKSNL